MRYPKILTAHSAKDLIGKTIKWHAPAYEGNEDYQGVAKITTVDISRERPVFTITIEGDCLDYAFVDSFNLEDFTNKLLCYSDSGRYVTFELVEEINKPTFTAVYDTKTNKNINYSFQSSNFQTAIDFCKEKISSPIKRLIGEWPTITEEKVYICDSLEDFVKKHNGKDFMFYHPGESSEYMDEKLLKTLKEDNLENTFDSVLKLRDHLFTLSCKISKNEN